MIEEIEECLKFLASDIRDGNCGFVSCPFLGLLLSLIDRLWKGKHVLEEPSL
jgi:hypothetical protein